MFHPSQYDDYEVSVVEVDSFSGYIAGSFWSMWRKVYRWGVWRACVALVEMGKVDEISRDVLEGYIKGFCWACFGSGGRLGVVEYYVFSEIGFRLEMRLFQRLTLSKTAVT